MNIRCISCFEQYDNIYDVCPYCGYYKYNTAIEPFRIIPGILLQGRYIIGMVLGYGGFGIVYKVWDVKLQTVFAIKEYFPNGIVDRIPGTTQIEVYAKKRLSEFDCGYKHFVDEAKNMARFAVHNNIVSIYGCFEENQTAYLVMEYLEGAVLSEILKNNRFDPGISLTIIHNICKALKDIHAAGITHRDVSPSNIFICTNNKIKLIDFGTAYFSINEGKLLTIILNPGYAPPEQYEQINVQGPRTDIYAIGATLYFMLTGVKPVESKHRIYNDTLRPPSMVNPHVSAKVNNAIMRAMALDIRVRYNTVDEFEYELG